MSTEAKHFDYDSAFKLNYGIFSRDEQEGIKSARVTIVGTGGAGGGIAVILARTGVTNFILIDPDRYDESNTNRQIGCFVDTLGKCKAEVMKGEILRINPEAHVKAYTRKLSFDELGELLDESDVLVTSADDLAFSSAAIRLAQQRKVFALSLMPSGLVAYIMVFPPDLSRMIDPATLFGAPKGLSYEELRDFLGDPVNKAGRRWYVTQGKWRIDWFKKWRVNQPKLPLAQICPSVWLGASLASLEIVKYLTGKWKKVRVPKMWHLLAADNRIRVERFRTRSLVFGKIVTWAFNIKPLGIGEWIRNFTSAQIEKELDEMAEQEKEGKEVTVPFMWRHVI